MIVHTFAYHTGAAERCTKRCLSYQERLIYVDHLQKLPEGLKV